MSETTMRRRPVRWFLVPAIVLLLVLAGLPWLFPGGAPPPAQPRATAGAAASQTLPPIGDLAETVQRPLFHSLRQPVKAADSGPAAGSGPVVIGRYRLIGVISADNRRQAMLARMDTGRSALYAAGDALDDWKVVAVLEDGLTVARGAENDTIRLKSAAPRQ